MTPKIFTFGMNHFYQNYFSKTKEHICKNLNSYCPLLHQCSLGNLAECTKVFLARFQYFCILNPFKINNIA